MSVTLDQVENRFLESSQRRQAIAEQMAREKNSIRERESSLHSLALEQDVPSEEAVLDARRRRDEGWRLVRAAWLEEAQGGQDVTAFLASFAPGGTLAEAYSHSVKHADALADRLRREADRVARKAELQAALARHQDSFAEFEQAQKTLEHRHAVLEEEWNSLVAPLGNRPARWTPAELRTWLRQREGVVELIKKVEEIREGVEPIEQTTAFHRAAVQEAFTAISDQPPVDGIELAELLERSEELIKRHDLLVQNRAQLSSTLAASRAEQAGARLSLESAQRELDAWRLEWSDKMRRLGLEPGASPAQAEVVLTALANLFQELDSHREFQKRIQGIDRDTDRFALDVGALTERLARDLGSHPVVEQARELASRLRRAQADARQAAAFLQQQEREEGHLGRAEAQYEEARVCLDRLCHEANCAASDQLAEAEQRWQESVRLDKELATVQEELTLATAGNDPAHFIALAEGADTDALDASIKEIETRIASLENDQRAVQETIGAAREALSRMNGGADAADMAENIQTLAARLQSDVCRFATLKVAAAVLHRGIEHYREQNQGPILARAGELFAVLTGGSFTRLQIDDDGDGHLVVKGVRPGGRLVGVEGMSDGTHDQLYLALRLASLESWLESHEAVPFIVDDILLNFDDDRSIAALAALAELSRKTQVLFFTHHHHLVELARTRLPRELVFTHELIHG